MGFMAGSPAQCVIVDPADSTKILKSATFDRLCVPRGIK